jgi:hypothetical protein
MDGIFQGGHSGIPKNINGSSPSSMKTMRSRYTARILIQNEEDQKVKDLTKRGYSTYHARHMVKIVYQLWGSKIKFRKIVVMISVRKCFSILLSTISVSWCTVYIAAQPAGERYQAEVPDTLDLSERCALALRSITEYTREHLGAGGACTPKIFEAQSLVRMACGNSMNLDLGNKDLQEIILDNFKDGLLLIGGAGSPNGPYLCMYSQGRVIRAFDYYHQITGDPVWLERANAAAEKLRDIAIVKGDMAYYPTGPFSMVRIEKTFRSHLLTCSTAAGKTHFCLNYRRMNRPDYSCRRLIISTWMSARGIGATVTGMTGASGCRCISAVRLSG